VQELIESKSKGKAAPKPEKSRRLAPVVDLMTALKKSLAGAKQSSGGSRSSKRLRKTA
jgi:non-homologous end joining protein Ku